MILMGIMTLWLSVAQQTRFTKTTEIKYRETPLLWNINNY